MERIESVSTKDRAISEESLREILKLRASGMTWREIAKRTWTDATGNPRRYHEDAIRKRASYDSARAASKAALSPDDRWFREHYMGWKEDHAAA